MLSQDAKKVLFSKGSDYGIADVKADQKTTDGLLALDKHDGHASIREPNGSSSSPMPGASCATGSTTRA